MSLTIDDYIVFTGRWITVHRLPRLAGMKTDRYVVLADNHEAIATIRWYSAWRKYSLFPERWTVWEPTCLREIAAFLEQLTQAQRQGQTPRKRHEEKEPL